MIFIFILINIKEIEEYELEIYQHIAFLVAEIIHVSRLIEDETMFLLTTVAYPNTLKDLIEEIDDEQRVERMARANISITRFRCVVVIYLKKTLSLTTVT